MWVCPSRFCYSSNIRRTTPLPCRPQPLARSLPVPKVAVPPVPGLLSSSAVLHLHPLLCRPVSWCLLVVCRLLVTLLRTDKRLGRIHSLAVARPIPRLQATRPCRRRSVHLPPPPPRLPSPSPPILFMDQIHHHVTPLLWPMVLQSDQPLPWQKFLPLRSNKADQQD